MRQAVDIALLPRGKEMKSLVLLNGELRRSGDDEIRLATEPSPGEGLPHMTLAMGLFNLNDLGKISRALQTRAKTLSVLRFKGAGFHCRQNSAGGSTSSLHIELTEDLKKLHEESMALRELFHCGQAQEQHLLEADDGDAGRALRWINDFEAVAAFARFEPHITIGHGGPILAEAPGEILFNRLGLYALGPGCTCRKELIGFRLGAND